MKAAALIAALYAATALTELLRRLCALRGHDPGFRNGAPFCGWCGAQRP